MRLTTLAHAPPHLHPRRAGRIHLIVDCTTWRRGRTRRALGRPSCNSSSVVPGLCLPTRSGGSDAPSKYSSALHTTVPPFVVAHLFAFTAPPSLTFTAKIHLASSSWSLARSRARPQLARLTPLASFARDRALFFRCPSESPKEGKSHVWTRGKEGIDGAGRQSARSRQSPLRHVLY